MFYIKNPKNFYSPYGYRSDESFLNDNSNNTTINQLDYTSSIIAHNEELTNTQKVYTKVYILSDTFSSQKHKKVMPLIITL